jgi:hypothetical protein
LSEASAFTSEVPEGWYADPAKPDMERWWTGTEWTDHVRYTDKPQPRSFEPTQTAPVVVEIAAQPSSLSLRPTEHQSFVTADQPAMVRRMPTAPPGFPESTFDRFYIPMRGFEARHDSQAPLRARSRARAVGLWIAVMAVVGIAIGVGAWALFIR